MGRGAAEMGKRGGPHLCTGLAGALSDQESSAVVQTLP